ncbi:MAG: ATP-binding protein [Robiginitomaculum sp.]|nr:ATP-binding protein [Robiginitomaculum sp.]
MEHLIQNNLIAHKADTTDVPTPGLVHNVWWLWFFAALAIGATLVASWQGKALGWPAFILLAGISVVSMLAILTIFFNRQNLSTVVTQNSTDANILFDSFRVLPVPSLIVLGGKPFMANTAYFELARSLGVEALEGVPPSVERLFSRQEKSASAAIFRLHHTNNANEIGEEVIRTLDTDGDYRSFKVRVSAIKDGQLWQIQDDINAEANDTSILAQAPIGLFSVSTDGTILKTNAVLQAWVGFNAETVPEHMKEFIESPGALLDSAPTPGRTVRTDTRLLTKKGVVSPIVLMGSWHEMDSGDVYASVAVYGHSGLGTGKAEQEAATDIVGSPAQISVSNQASENADNNMETLDIQNAPFGMVMLDSTDLNSAKILQANEAMRNMVDGEISKTTSFKSLFVENTAAEEFFAGGINVQDGPVDVNLRGKQARPVDVYFAAPDEAGCTVYIIDVTSRKMLEDKLGQSQKMQAIGQLAGGVAHDFNNLLTAIRLNTDELLGRHPIGDPSYPELQKINQTVSRATGLVRKLLAFSRKQTLRTVVLDVTNTLSDLTHLLQDVLVERVQLKVIHGRGLLPIQADKGQLETVLMNLCVNARDAMLEKSGGTITLKSSKVTDEELREQGIEIRKKGSYVRFDVADTGTGMDKKTQDKIFEPFFTTKAQGKGTGLGLATVYGIVQQSGGHLRVQSELGVGTTFSVYIPTATGDVQTAPAPKPQIAAARIKPSDLAGQGNILFVEDEASVRVIAAKTLRKRGYTVVEAEDGEIAYEILEAGEEKFDLMISDVVMPGMDGPTLLKKGRDLLGGAAIVFISGYAEEEFSELLAEEPDVTFLPKPFTLIQLAEKVKSVLADPE